MQPSQKDLLCTCKLHCSRRSHLKKSGYPLIARIHPTGLDWGVHHHNAWCFWTNHLLSKPKSLISSKYFFTLRMPNSLHTVPQGGTVFERTFRRLLSFPCHIQTGAPSTGSQTDTSSSPYSAIPQIHSLSPNCLVIFLVGLFR